MSNTILNNKIIPPTFYLSDFNNDSDKYNYWVSEFSRATSLKGVEVRKWAKKMLEYLDDITLEYIRSDVRNYLNELILGE